MHEKQEETHFFVGGKFYISFRFISSFTHEILDMAGDSVSQSE